MPHLFLFQEHYDGMANTMGLVSQTILIIILAPPMIIEPTLSLVINVFPLAFTSQDPTLPIALRIPI